VTVAIRTFVAELGATAEPAPTPDATAVAMEVYAGTSRQGRGRLVLLQHLEASVRLIARVAGPRAAQGPTRFGIEVASILAASVGLLEDAERLRALRDDTEAHTETDAASFDRTDLARALGGPMQRLGESLKGRLLADDHPLLDGAFHRLLDWRAHHDLTEIAEVWYASSQLDTDRLLTALGRSLVQRMHFVEAVIGLIWADGRIDPMEQRLVRELIAIGSFSSDDVRLLKHMLAHAPPSPTDIAAWVTDPVERELLLEQLILASLVDGEVDAAEERFLAALGEAFEVAEADRVARQLQLIAHIDAHPELLGGLSFGGVMGRFRRHAQRRVEGVVRDNLHAIVTEVRETGDLFQLLARATHTPLTPDETARVRAQLIDICKTIPSLALLAAPGGTILLPILMKILPFSLMPSAFEEKDEVL